MAGLGFLLDCFGHKEVCLCVCLCGGGGGGRGGRDCVQGSRSAPSSGISPLFSPGLSQLRLRSSGTSCHGGEIPDVQFPFIFKINPSPKTYFPVYATIYLSTCKRISHLFFRRQIVFLCMRRLCIIFFYFLLHFILKVQNYELPVGARDRHRCI